MTTCRRAALTIVLALISCSAALPALADDAVGGEVGLLLGFTVPDEDFFGPTADAGASFGLRGGSVFRPNWGWFVDGLLTDLDDVSGDTRVLVGRSGFEHLLMPNRDNRFFVSLSGGWMKLDYDNLPVRHGPIASAGVGMRYRMSPQLRLRWELRGDYPLNEDDWLRGQRPSLAHLLVGATWGPGGSWSDARPQPDTDQEPSDSDHDGVADRRDRCADTPPGESVDARGCPDDADGDGVIDRRDRCASTPTGATIDESGCPLDGDRDGVFDGLDGCPRSPLGDPVDGRGCPRDTDGDGIADDVDACPGTPTGARPDARGCSQDSDLDGIADGFDRCPDTRRGTAVDATGCPRDTDRDGIPNDRDRCPNSPVGSAVDGSGCPPDADDDGVGDARDRCPSTPPGATVGVDGCPTAERLFEDRRSTFVMEGVRFESNRAVLTSDSRAVIDRVARVLADQPGLRIEIGGHTDSRGAAAYNLELSTRRARAVRDELVARGVSAKRMTVRGYGEMRPLADNESAGGRAQNRRVELTRVD